MTARCFGLRSSAQRPSITLKKVDRITGFTGPTHTCRQQRAATGLAARSGSQRQIFAQVKPCESPLPPLHLQEERFSDLHSFSSYANWVIPGSLLVGRYPYVDPNRFRSRSHGEKVLRSLLEAGITNIVCLQGELPPQQEMRIGGMYGFLPYHATATLLAASMSGLPPEKEMTGLRNEHLNQFLPPKRNKKTPADEQDSNVPKGKRIRLEFTHIPVMDLGIPTHGQVQALVDQVHSWLKAGKQIYLHCWGGRGRAGTMAACILVSLYGLSAQQALEHVQTAYDTRGEGRRSPETSEQMQFVMKWEALQCR